MRTSFAPCAALAAALLAGVWSARASAAEDPLTLPQGPWTDAWTMEMRGAERAFVVLGGKDYLWTVPEDYANPALLQGQDLALAAKFSRNSGNRPIFYGLERIAVTSADVRLAAAVDGDNFFLFGRLDTRAGAVTLTVEAVETAPGDGEQIARRLAAIPAEGYAARLDLCDALEAEAVGKGNRSFWLEQAAHIRIDTIQAAATRAGAKADPVLLRQTMAWAIERAGSADLAASLASAEWVLGLAADARAPLEAMLRSRGYVFYEGGAVRGWMTQPAALSKEYERRFAAIHWRDAEGYFQLGLWAERYGDILPRATELAHRAFQLGHRADENHQGIRRMLGLSLGGAAASTTASTAATARTWASEDGRLSLDIPLGWERSESPLLSDARATWVDATSKIAYLAVLGELPGGVDANTLLAEATAQLQSLRDAQIEPAETAISDHRTTIRIPFRFAVNDGTRAGQALVLIDPDADRHAVLRAVAPDELLAPTLQALEALAASVRMSPPPAPPSEEAPPADGGEAPPAEVVP